MPYKPNQSNGTNLLASVKRADGVVVLGQGLVEPFSSWRGGERVRYLPHGVDVDFFRANPAVPKRREVLMVGNWLRDFDFANQVFRSLHLADPALEIHVVALTSNLDRLELTNRTHLHSNISDEELLHRYRCANCLFLPLLGFVANNALLEAGAVGCEVVLASNQSDGSVNLPFVTFVPLEVPATVNAIFESLNRPAPRSIDIRNWVIEAYGWAGIGKRMEALLTEWS